MTHPLEMQRRNMIEYQQIDIQGNNIIIDNESQMPNYLGEKLFLEEYKEKLQAQEEGNKEKLADAFGDMLICIAGAIIEHNIPLEIFSPHFQTKPFELDQVIVLHEIERIVKRFNTAITKYEKSILLANLWNSVVNEAIDNGFNIEGIYNAIAENNLARIDKDENGKPKRNKETKKIMRKNIHPDLTPFIL